MLFLFCTEFSEPDRRSFTGSVRNGSIQHYGTAAGSDFRFEQSPESEMSTEPNEINLNIGRRGGNNYLWNGIIDEVRIYNRALNEAEIKELSGLCNVAGDIDNDCKIGLAEAISALQVVAGLK